jgi:hypothetical protein
MAYLLLSYPQLRSYVDPILIKAFIVGALGSVAYITALYFKFIGGTDENRNIISGPFLRKDGGGISFAKIIWYCFIGGCISVIFQIDVPNFVAIQDFILGITWPAIVSQFLSGRMVYPNPEEISRVGRTSVTSEDNAEWERAKQMLGKKSS